MKKIVLSCVLLAGTFLGVAQTVYYNQNFEAGTTIPTGWTQTTLATDGGWKFGVNTALQSTYFPIPAHTKFACTNDDACNCNKSNDLLMSAVVNLTGAVHPYVSLDLFYGQGNYQGAQEVATLEVSTNGGTTWTVVKTFVGAANWNTVYQDLTPYAGMTNVMLGFRYNDGGGWMFGCAIDNVNVYEPFTLDMGVVSQNLNYYLQKGTPYIVSGSVFNYGSSTITSLTSNYSVNGAAAVPTPVTGLSVLPDTAYTFTSGTPWTPSVSGINTMKLWATNLNGSADLNHSNDTLTVTFDVLDSLQIKKPLFEEFNQASCDPCAQATPNLDSVLSNSNSICSAVRYHVSWPGTDYMNQITGPLFVAARVAYYTVSGVPDAKLDGAMDVYPGAGGMSSPLIQTEAAGGSPLKITLSAIYSTTTKQFFITSNIKAYGTMPAGLKAYCALTIDTITYHASQTTETIPQTVFPQVAEEMIPSSSGTTLAAFTSGQSQPLNLTWTKNHPWGANFAAWPYDSTTAMHITVWVQDNTSKTVYQSENTLVQIVAGIDELSSASNLNIFPNPNNGQATIRFELKQEEYVKIAIYNSMGQLVNSMEPGMLHAGSNTVNFDGQDLSTGIYFVNVISGNQLVSKKINIIK
jgi:hypothetical protein